MTANPIKRSLKRILWRISPQILHRLLSPSKNQFSIGIYAGDSPFNLGPAKNLSNPVLARADIEDAPAGTVADPFMLKVDQSWFMFFEVLNQFHGKGEIAVATSRDALDWTYRRIVLAEPFHMSYPHVFEWDGKFFMLPETGRDQSVRLYKAHNFPFDWRLESILLEGQRYADSSIFRFEDRWWLFTDTGVSGKSPLLRLFFATDLYGPWTEHPESPLANGDLRISRPGGRVIIIKGVPYRFAQSIEPVYGTELRAFEIIELDTVRYRESPVGEGPLLGPGSDAWNRHGMHHIDLHPVEGGSWLACVDGCVRRDFDESLLQDMTKQSDRQ